MNMKGEKDKNMRNKGITLIALVITIIVLLILAAVSIATLTGENGILTRANDAKEETEIASVKEQAQLDIANWIAERLENGEDTTLDDATIKNIIETANASNTDKYYKELQSDKIITPSGYEILYSELYTNNGGSGGQTGSLPSTAETTPFLPDGATVTNANLDTGVTIKDEKNNEWTWIEVPRSIYDNEAYYTNGATKPENSEDYTNIETIMQNYASSYRSSYTDTWYSEAQHGFESADEYNNHKKAMLKSVYENGGFYIGKYEVGSFDNPVTSNNNTRKAVIQKGAYPYNYVTCKQAQELSESLAVGGKTSSLMFGIQWDLVLAYLESKGVPEADLNDDSSSWGNYANNSFQVAEGNKYAIYNQSTYQLGDWNPVPSGYEKPNSGTENKVLLSTGAVESNSKMNIYDLAGNVWEWTLEKSTGTRTPCAFSGGGYDLYGSGTPASYRSSYSTSSSSDIVGIRPALY